MSGFVYPSVEHAYQAAKTLVDSERHAIQDVSTPAQAKKLGRGVTIQPLWDDLKIPLMRSLLKKKFSMPHEQYLIYLLLGTAGHDLIETNNWGDRFWGVCGGSGKNQLGKLLMEVRADLEKEKEKGR